MKIVKITLLALFLVGGINSLNAQTVLKYIQSEINTMINKDSQSWKASEYVYGSVNVNDAEEYGKQITIKGTFVANITQWPFGGKRTINFTAEAKQVLDDITIKKVYWTQPITGLHWCIGDCD